MTIIVDDREPEQYRLIADKIEHLDHGDFVLSVANRRYVIERKTPSGYLTDLRTGRLQTQLSGCNALLIDFSNITANNYVFRGDDTTRAFWDCISGTSLHHTTLFTLNITDLKKMLQRYHAKLEDGTIGVLRVPVVKNAALHRSVDILARFPGVGLERATELLKIYKTLGKVFYAADNMDTIRGVGPVTLSGITETLDEEVELE